MRLRIDDVFSCYREDDRNCFNAWRDQQSSTTIREVMLKAHVHPGHEPKPDQFLPEPRHSSQSALRLGKDNRRLPDKLQILFRSHFGSSRRHLVQVVSVTVAVHLVHSKLVWSPYSLPCYFLCPYRVLRNSSLNRRHILLARHKATQLMSQLMRNIHLTSQLKRRIRPSRTQVSHYSASGDIVTCPPLGGLTGDGFTGTGLPTSRTQARIPRSRACHTGHPSE